MPLPALPSQLRLFLEKFLPLAFSIILVAGGFWLVEQHGHQQLLSGANISNTTEQTRHLLALFNTHQLESIGSVTLIALLVAAMIACYSAGILRRQMFVEQQNREQLRKIELLLDSTVEGIYAVDRSGICIMANRSCAQILGYNTPADLLGQQMHGLVHHTRADGSPYPLEQCKAHQIIATGAVASSSDEIFWRRDGSSLPVAYTAHPIRDDQQIIGMVCTFVDLTEQKQAEARMGVLEEQLRQAQKMEAIGQLASGVAHDFNNILQVISGNAQLLELTNKIDPPTLQSRVSEIIKAVERGINLTRAMLAFARRQAIALRPLELNQLLQETEPLARNLLTKQQLLHLQLHPASLTVVADATLLQQVLFNLVTNARDAMPGGGTVTIGTRLSDQPPENSRTAEPQTNHPYAVLWVQDTGQGISQEIRDKVFEPFFTTKPVGKGTGLGLAMIYGTIQQHHGFVQIESEPGAGSTISVYLPC